MTDNHLINIILNNITPCLCLAMAQYEDLRSDLSKQQDKFLYKDFITTEFQKKEQDNRSKGQGKKRGMGEQVQLIVGELAAKKKQGEFVAKHGWDKGKEEGRCMKCGRINHKAWDWQSTARVKTPPFPDNANQEPVQKKRKFDRVHLKIPQVGAEEDSENK